jgi:histidinol-phosphate aminotransferase
MNGAIVDTGLLAHGGPDDGPPISADFSTNAHPCGPNPFVLAAVRAARIETYPDPAYRGLREALAQFHGVASQRIVVGASASELVWRITRLFATVASRAAARVAIDPPTYGEYARAAHASGLATVPSAGVASDTTILQWICSPNNPSGELREAAIERALADRRGTQWPPVIDLAYHPFQSLLRNDAARHPGVLHTAWADRVVQLWSPNKLHGLTGVRGAYLVLPAREDAALTAHALTVLAPSWVLGADGVAMLHAHVLPQALGHVSWAQPELQCWKAAQDGALHRAGWTVRESPLHFGLARPPWPDSRAFDPMAWHAHLRRHGVKLRDAASFGLPGWVRLSVRPPQDVARLIALTQAFLERA